MSVKLPGRGLRFSFGRQLRCFDVYYISLTLRCDA